MAKPGRDAEIGGGDLRYRLLTLLAAMVLPFVVFSFFRADQIKDQLLAQYYADNLRLARSVASSIDDNIEANEELLHAIAMSDVARDGDYAAMSTWFAQILGHCDHYANIVFVDTAGDVVATGLPLPPGKHINVTEKSWFQRSMESTELAIGEFAYAKIGGTPDVHLSLPVFGRDGQRRGVVSVAMHLTRVQDRLMRERTPRHTTIAVIDPKGTVIARNHDPEKWVGTDVAKVFHLTQMKATGEGKDQATLDDGVRLVCAYTTASFAPWMVRVGVDRSHIEGLARSQVLAHYAVFIPLLLLAVAGWLSIGRDVVRLHRQTEELALADALTGLLNSRSLRRDFEHALAHARRANEQLSFAMLDLDDFKAYNDRFGHIAGDGALQAVSAAILSAVRSADHVYRYGGEEFCVLLPDSGTDGAAAVMERVREAVAALEMRPDADEQPVRMSISIGVAEYPADATSPDDLMTCADAALYAAKRAGKNRVVLHCGCEPEPGD